MASENISIESCPICKGNYEIWAKKMTEYGEFIIVKCLKCGYAFVNPRPKLDFLMQFYSEIGHGPYGISDLSYELVLENEKQYPNSSLDAKRIINSSLKLLNAKYATQKKFLDIGCGYGFFSLEALKFGFEVTALELASTERKIAEQMTGLKPVQKSFEDFQSEKSNFEVILMSQILEHAHDVVEWIRKAHLLLKPNGILAIALPNFGSLFRLILKENEPYICPPSHLNYFDQKSLAILLENNGFEVCKVEYISRLPYSAVYKRLNKFGIIFPRLIYCTIPLPLYIIDKLNLGSILNIYGRKLIT